MVRGVCRRMLGDEHDTDDAFQAVFVVLARKAGTIHKRESLASWLHGVAANVAQRARERRNTRRTHEQHRDELPDTADDRIAASEVLERREILSVLDEEVRRLPRDERRAIVLHYFQGLSQADTAQELGWPAGSIWWRLEQAREQLRMRLTARGIGISSAALAALLPETASAVPPALLETTVATALAPSLAGLTAALSAEVLASMAMSKTKYLVAGVVVIAAATGGTYWYTSVTRPASAPGKGLVAAGSERRRDVGDARQKPAEEKKAEQKPAEEKKAEPPPEAPWLPVVPLRARVGEDAKKNIAHLAILLAREDKRAGNWATETASGIDVESLMYVFLPRKNRNKGYGHDDTFGVGDIPGKFAPDGIERMLLALEKKSAPKLERAVEMEMAYRVRAVAEILWELKPPATVKKNGLAAVDGWKKYVEEFDQSAKEYTSALGRNESTAAAIKRLNAACLACHSVGTNGDDIHMVSLPTEKLLAFAKKPPDDNSKLAELRQAAALRALSLRALEREEVVPAAMEALKSPTQSIQESALAILRVVGENDRTGEPEIDKALQSTSAAFRYQFAYEARRLKSVAAACQVLLESPKSEVRMRGIRFLGMLGKDGISAQAALEKLQKSDPDSDVRLAAGVALGQINKGAQLPTLLRGLRDADPVVRGRAAQALVKQGVAAVPGLRAALAEKDRDVRASAVSALARIGPPASDAAPDLSALLKDEDMLVRKLAADALKRIQPTDP
jgi:RNA polymerase sigma factor (sigma-70 family)